MSETTDWAFRLAEASDAEAFTKWTFENPLIDPKDIQAAKKKNNPTAMYFAVDSPDGRVIAFAPVYMQALLAHLVFNPESTSEERKQAMQMGMSGLIHILSEWGIREIVTMSKEEYPVAQWALKNGFDLEPRQLLKFDMNKVLPVAKEENTCAPVAEK
jgi:hypothetical protein